MDANTLFFVAYRLLVHGSCKELAESHEDTAEEAPGMGTKIHTIYVYFLHIKQTVLAAQAVQIHSQFDSTVPQAVRVAKIISCTGAVHLHPQN